MRRLVVQLLSRIDSLTLPKRVILLVGCMVIIFVAWRYCLWNDLIQRKTLLNTRVKLAKREMLTIGNALQTTRQKMQDENGNEQPSKKFIPNKKETNLVSPEEITQVLQDILFARHDLELLQIENLPVKKVAPPNTELVFFEYGIVIKFRGSYFAALRYLHDLENLHWPLFWDKLDYRVVKYPQAEVTLFLHTVSTQEGWIHV
ncbi:MAG: hypothetical protein AMJ43_01040 [Coxiella sp. DG_40]|nr:MAG: hypothetical protein AMJ43_01040 [Coxiella sp. DG_40]